MTSRFLRDLLVFVRTICSRATNLGPIGVCRQAYTVHGQGSVTGVQRVEEFAAWQLADAFKSEVFALLKGSREAMRDRRFRYQLKNSASGPPKHITEGFVRFSPRSARTGTPGPVETEKS